MDNTQEFIAGLQANCSTAQRVFFEEYYTRLLSLVHSNLQGHMQRRVGASDIAQSALRSFYAAAREGRFDLAGRSEIWRLLVTITLNKMRDQARRHHSAKRSIHSEDQTGCSVEGESAHRVPGPEDVSMLQDEVDHVLERLGPSHREIGTRIVLGEKSADIAAATRRSMRTVRRVEKALVEALIQRFQADTAWDEQA